MNQRLPFTLAAGLLAAALAQPPLAAGQTPASTPAVRSRTPVTLNFVNADIEAVSRAMGVMLDRPLLVDPRVKGNITLYSEQPLSVQQAYQNYLASLRGLGFTVVESGGMLKVVPEADAKLQTGTVSIGSDVARRGDQIITQIFKLSHENANNLVAVLRPLISPNNTINANAGNNTLVITDYAENLARLGKIIATLDTPAGSEVEVIPLQHAVASDLAPLLQKLVDGSGGGPTVTPGGPVPGTASAAVSVLTDTRSNSLIVRTANPTRMATVRALIDKLDRPNAAGGGPAGNIYVVHLKNADAIKLAQVLRAAITANQQGGGGGGGLTGASNPLSPSQTTPTSSSTSGTSSSFGGMNANTPGTSPLSPSANPSTGGSIQADPATNSLIITAPEPLYRQMRAMIERLDTRRAQVYIESMIVEITGDNSAEFGFQWQGLFGKDGDNNIPFAGTNFGSGVNNIIGLTTALSGGSAGAAAVASDPPEGLNIGLIHNFAGNYGLAVLARMLQSQTSTNIISTPNLITLDNEEAKIIVGNNVPFITGQFTNTGTSTTSPFQTIERQDVGITLKIKPQIGENGTVRMTIYQESSSVSSTVAPGTSNAGPSTSKRSIESTVVVDDGQILVLGGLIEDRYTDNNSKVPLLGDIPILGNLFRTENRTKTRTNLMVFLRPVVMRDGDVATRMSMDRYDMIRARQQAAQPKPSLMLNLISDSPVLPPARAMEGSEVPLSAPPSTPAPGAAPAAAPPPQAVPAPAATSPVVPPPLTLPPPIQPVRPEPAPGSAPTN